MPGRLRVLIADDYPGMVRAISRLLAIEYDVVGSVADGSGVMDAVQRLRPDVVILDMSLPDIDGAKVCRQITQQNPSIKVIVYTAIDDAAVRQRALDAGASAVVLKRGGGNDLLTTVRSLDGGGEA